MSSAADSRTHGASSLAALRSLTLELCPVRLGTFLSLPIEGSRIVWDATGEGEIFSFAARGVAAAIDARGAHRCRIARDWADELFSGGEPRDDGPAGPPPPRVFGAMTFAIGAPHDGPWRGFSEARFVLPRLLYARSATRAFLRLTVPPAEAGAAGRAELEAIARTLEASSAHPEVAPPPRAKLEQMPLGVWTALVERALAALARGEFGKVVLARRSRLLAEQPIEIAGVMDRLAAGQPGGARFAVEQGEGVFLGASPERLVTRRGRVAEMDALAGSLPRAAGLDAERAAALLASTKDREEHRFVIEGIRAALAPLGASVAGPSEPSVLTLRTVHHLRTPLRAELSAPAHVLDLVAALHPTPAVCGTPREAARAFIARSEPASRGCYAGPVGWFDRSGDGSFWVGLRSAVVRGREAWLFSGAGLVQGSDPGLEYDETRAKQDAILSSLGALP